VKHPRYTVTLRDLTIDDLASLQLVIDGHPPHMLQAHMRRELARVYRESERANVAWRRRTYKFLRGKP
jgi:hypothetical protein